MASSSGASSTPRPSVTVRLAGGRVALGGDASRIVLAAATDGAPADVVLHAPEARAWAGRVATVLEAHAASPDVTPVEVRTPWLRGDDGEPALAIERVTRGPQVRWRLLVRARGLETAVAGADADVVELLRRLVTTGETAREAG
jgi:hypothetical protein